MKINHIKKLARTAWALRNYLKSPLTLEQAMEDIKTRMDNRENNFLRVVKKLVYENQNSPYRKLLLWAGCGYKDLEDSVRTKGIEKTLEKLRDDGVYITLEEFKSKSPVCRKGLTFEVREADFNNPFLTGRGFQGSTSGSRSKSTRVIYDWDFLSEEAANVAVMYAIHGVSNAPLAFWSLELPATSGIHNLLLNIKFRTPPERWFSPLDTKMVKYYPENHLTTKYILWCCRILGVPVPRPEFTDINSAERVARWMEETNKSKGISVVRTFTSSAVRIVQSALENGIDISGSVIYVGGEPLTERRSRFIKSAGVKVFPRYIATETGLIGASCGNGTRPDDMHIHLERLAIIQRERKTAVGGYGINSFLLTSLSFSAGKVLLNTEIGDFGRLTVEPCGCLFGKLGMDVHISDVHSHDKLTGEGMTLLGSELDDIVGELVENAGGGPDDYQFWETQDDMGLSKLVIAVSPGIPGLDEKRFIEAILEKINNRNLFGTSQLWRQADTLQVVRAYPELTRGCKMLPIIKKS